MKKYMSLLLIGVSFVGFASSAMAADIIEAPMMDTPEPQEVIASTGGWYIRGDVGYAMMKSKGVKYEAGNGKFDSADAKSVYLIGGGLGYQVTDIFRVDVTGDYEFNGKFRGTTSNTEYTCDSDVQNGTCHSVDQAKYTVFELMANAYADLGTFSGFTPYVGAGIGAAHVSWGDLNGTNTDEGGIPEVYPPYKGESSTRFAWALMAGTSYDLTSNLKMDLGYRYKRIESGPMFSDKDDYVPFGYDKGFDVHQVKLGLRYQFGGAGSSNSAFASSTASSDSAFASSTASSDSVFK